MNEKSVREDNIYIYIVLYIYVRFTEIECTYPGYRFEFFFKFSIPALPPSCDISSKHALVDIISAPKLATNSLPNV